jgi:hypothetical protein
MAGSTNGQIIGIIGGESRCDRSPAVNRRLVPAVVAWNPRRMRQVAQGVILYGEEDSAPKNLEPPLARSDELNQPEDPGMLLAV